MTESLQDIQKEKEALEMKYKDAETTFDTQIDCLTTEMEACNQELSTVKDENKRT
jgi:hypothetical protein